MKDLIIEGNINKEKQIIENQKGWIFGHFVPKKSKFSIFKNKNFEVHWGSRKKGDSNENVVYNETSYTLGILLKGKISIILYKNKKEKKEYLLQKEGDYLVFGPGVPHDWIALKDSLILGVRWPSVPNDQKIFIKKE